MLVWMAVHLLCLWIFVEISGAAPVDVDGAE